MSGKDLPYSRPHFLVLLHTAGNNFWISVQRQLTSITTRNTNFLNWILCSYPQGQLNLFQMLLQNTASGEEVFRVDFYSDSGGVHITHHFRVFLHTADQSLDNKIDELRARISFQRDIRDCNVLCFMETWLSPDILSLSLQPAGFSVQYTNRNKELSGKK